MLYLCIVTTSRLTKVQILSRLYLKSFQLYIIRILRIDWFHLKLSRIVIEIVLTLVIHFLIHCFWILILENLYVLFGLYCSHLITLVILNDCILNIQRCLITHNLIIHQRCILILTINFFYFLIFILSSNLLG